MRRVLMLLLAGTAAAAVAGSAIAQDSYIFRYKSGLVENPGGPGQNPDNPPGQDPDNPPGGDPGISDPDPDGEDPGPYGFNMVALDGATGANIAHRCFEVTQGSGHYAYDVWLLDIDDLPAWFRGLDIVPPSQLSSPFTSTADYVIYPATEGQTVAATTMCARIAYDANPTGSPLLIGFSGMDFAESTYDGDIYDAMAGWEGFSFAVTPAGYEPPPEPQTPPPIVGDNPAVDLYAPEEPMIEVVEEPGANLPSQLVVMPTTRYNGFTDCYDDAAGEACFDAYYRQCFAISGGHGNYSYALALNVNASSGTSHWNLEVNDNNQMLPVQQSTYPLAVGSGYSTTAEDTICMEFDTWTMPSSLRAGFQLQVFDFPTPGSKPHMEGRSAVATAVWSHSYTLTGGGPFVPNPE